MEFEKIDDLIQELNSREIIGIDGCDGSGETHLSKKIAEKLNCAVLNLDNFVEKDKGNYVENLKVSEVKQFIEKQKSPLIIEGVCLIEILKS
jgi:shikimate kinase